MQRKKTSPIPKIPRFWLMVSALVAIVLLDKLYISSRPKPTDNNQPAAAPAAQEPEAEFVVDGGNIYHLVNGIKELLFTNAASVSDVRPGPDGDTLHFNTPGDASLPRCANLNQLVQTDTSQATQPPEQAWDYRQIGRAGQLDSCGDNGAAGGFVPGTDYFVWVKSDAIGLATLWVASGSSAAAAEFPLDAQTWANNASSSQAFMPGVPDGAGSTYSYPQRSAVADGKLLLAIGRLLIAVDPAAKKFLGAQPLEAPQYHVTQDSYWFDTDAHSPLVLVETGWEASNSFTAVADLGGAKLTVLPLDSLKQPLARGYKVPLYEWGAGGLTLHFYSESDITSHVAKADLAYFDAAHTPQEYAAKNQELQKKLAPNGYLDALCQLGPDQERGACWGLKPGMDYHIAPGDTSVHQ